MIRQPTPLKALYAWHRAAIAGEAPPMHEGAPECGWFKTRIVKGGPWVAVEIKVEREIDIETGELAGDERLIALVDGVRRNPASIWTHLTPISREEFEALKRRQADLPEMQATHVRMDLSQEPVRP